MSSLILLIVITLLSIIAIVLLIVFRYKPANDLPLIQTRLSELQNSLTKIESNLKDDFRINREENAGIAKENRNELNDTLKDIKAELSETLKTITEQSQNALKEINKTLAEKVDALVTKIDENNKTNRETLASNLKDFALEQRNKFDELKQEQKETTLKTTTELEKITAKVEEKLNTLNEQAKNDNMFMREALVNAFKGFQETFDKNVTSFNDLQKEKFAQMDIKQNELIKGTETKLENIRITVEEKLEKTLSERLSQSFETVGKQLIEVQKGLGEMQNIASDVGGLKKVLSNVKLRGGVGEVQLAMLLEQTLAPNQYDANVRTKKAAQSRWNLPLNCRGVAMMKMNLCICRLMQNFQKMLTKT